MCEAGHFGDREDYIFKIEQAQTTLRIIADACGNGGYTGTENVEKALNLLADNISDATTRLRQALWPGEETDADGRSADLKSPPTTRN